MTLVGRFRIPICRGTEALFRPQAIIATVCIFKLCFRIIIFRSCLIQCCGLYDVLPYSDAIHITLRRFTLHLRECLYFILGGIRFIFFRFFAPIRSLFRILFDADSRVITFCQSNSCLKIILLGRFLIPMNCFFCVPKNFTALRVIKLCFDQPCFGSFFQPLFCHFGVFLYTTSHHVADAQIILCFCVSLLCRFIIPARRFLITLHDSKTGTSFAAFAQAILCFRQPLICCFTIPFCRLDRIFYYTSTVFKVFA